MNDHDPIFVLATLLDLQYQLHVVLSTEQIASARTELLRKMKEIKHDNLSSPSESTAVPISVEKNPEPPSKQFWLLPEEVTQYFSSTITSLSSLSEFYSTGWTSNNATHCYQHL